MTRLILVRGIAMNLRLQWLVPAALVAWLAGCAAFRVPEEPPAPSPIRPVWSPQELRDHIRFLNGSEISGRATGTQGYARAAAYIAARMQEFKLQPAVEGDFRVVYGASINYPVSAALRAVGPADSLIFLPGIDFLPDARSDSGTADVARLVVASDGIEARHPPGTAFGILVPPGRTVDLAAWQRAGARLAVLIGDLNPRFQPAPVRNLIIVQMTEQGVGQLLDLGESSVSSFLASREGEVVRLPRSAYARVSTDFQPQAGAINIMGYFSGKHPKRQEELVIVCADLDAVGHLAGITTLDLRNFGVATASLLEVTRNLGYITERWWVPERSIMIAVWSGSQLGHEGLRYFLHHPTWDIEEVSAVVYLGLRSEEEAGVRQLLAAAGIPLVVIPPDERPLHETEIILIPDPAIRRLSRARAADVPRVEPPDMSQLIDTAAVRALDLADAAFKRVILEATADGPFSPVREDSLVTPPAGGTR